MLQRRRFLCLVSVVLVVRIGSSEDRAHDAGASVRVLTRDGDVLLGTLSVETLSVETRFGELTIPLADIRQIDLRREWSTEDDARLTKLLSDIEASLPNSTEADELQAELFQIALASRDELRKRSSSTRDRAAQVLKEVLESFSDSDDRTTNIGNPKHDRVVARKFTVIGKVASDEFTIATKYGPIRIARGQIERMAIGDAELQLETDRVLIVKTWSDPEREFANTRQAIDQRTKLRIVDFSGSSAADLKKALRGHRVLVLPEFEQGGSEQVAQELAKTLQQFVRTGGVIISCGGGNNHTFLSTSGVLPCSGGSDSSEATIRKRHPIFKGVQSPIPAADATLPIQSTGKPKMKALATSQSGDILVGVARLGAGAIIYCGWDYFDAPEPIQIVLANAVRWAAAGGHAAGSDVASVPSGNADE
jgi:hypothetical protein